MAPPSDSDTTFTAGCVSNRHLIYFMTETAFEHEGSTVGLVYVKKDKEWQNLLMPFPGLIAADIVSGAPGEPPAELTFVTAEGEFRYRAPPGPIETGVIDASANGPKGKGWIRGLKRVGERLYAVGMSRQAYVREGKVWSRIDADILCKAGEIAGLNDVDGFSDTEVYAAGLNGEIWRFDGSRWHSVPSPTNVQLNGVRRCGDAIYIAGGSGVLLRGRHDAFAVVGTEASKANLYSVESLHDQIFVSSMSAIYVLKGARLEKVKTKLKGAFTTGSLHAADGIMVSVGGKHLLTTEDGVTWTQLFT